MKRTKEGIGIITSQEFEQKVTAWDLVNSRIMNIDLDLEEKSHCGPNICTNI